MGPAPERVCAVVVNGFDSVIDVPFRFSLLSVNHWIQLFGYRMTELESVQTANRGLLSSEER